MNRLCKRMKFLSVLLFTMAGVVACGTVQSPTAMVPTQTPGITATLIPPTPTPEGHAPVIIHLDDRSISDGERFPKLHMEEHVTDEDHAAYEIDWQISGNAELELFFTGSNLYVTLPNDDWTGSERLRFEACDPTGLCDAREVWFTVRAENDAPVIGVVGQIIMSGEIFAEIDLDDVVDDEENEDVELTWNVNGNIDLRVNIDERIARIELPDPGWIGRETIRFEACDPEGACNSKDATFWVMERTEAPCEVTYIGNAGFMITVGDKKILIDALFVGNPIPNEVAELLETAQPPFDDVDLILVTHIHYDHFNAETVISHMEHNPGAMFVSSPDVVDAVNTIADMQDRTIPIQLRHRVGEKTQLVVDEIGVEAMFLDHGGGTLNLGYIITVDGRRLFHTGDMDPDTVSVAQLKRLGLPDKQIDIAFVAHFMLILEEQHAHILEGIRAKYIVPMHFQYSAPPPDYELMESYFPDAIVFHESLEIWVLPGDTSP
ncbi:MAG TPA: MBL fold metallo-hydrolase [Anaerolineae bacterium]|nr:MBL fold metallo-hydrolase [Anaerolineae bacterium]